MSLDCILLGILREPAAGYDIKQQFENVFRHFWSADLAQIYRALNKLEKDGLLVSRSEPSGRGPDRKVYERTTAGRQRLNKWLAGGPVFGTEKFTYLAQVFFLGAVGPAEREAFLRELREGLAAQLATLEAIDAGWRAQAGACYPDALDDDDFHAQLTLDMGLRKTRALVAWADDAIARIQKRGNAR